MKFKSIRKKTGLSQAKFARLIDVPLGTLRNWEQGRREAMRRAKALDKDPKNVAKANSA